MHEIIEQYQDVVIPIAATVASVLLLGVCCVFYKEMIFELLTAIFFKN